MEVVAAFGLISGALSAAGYSARDLMAWLRRHRNEPVALAINTTVLQFIGKFPRIRDQITRFLADSEVISSISSVSEGTASLDNIVELFISKTGFQYADQSKTRDKAREILEALASNLDDAQLAPDPALLHHDRKMAAVTAQLQKQMTAVLDHLNESASQVAIDYHLGQPVLDRPPAVSPVAARKATVDRYVGEYHSATWIALVGPIGIGKTQLAIQIADAVGTGVAWIRLRDLSPEHAGYRLTDALSAASALPPTPHWEKWCEQVCRVIGTGALVVLDDIPKLQGNETIAHQLGTLARVASTCGVRLLSTSAFDLPVQLTGVLGKHLLVHDSVPDFSDLDIRELLGAYDAPAHLTTEAFTSLLAANTKGHPILLVAAIHFMRESGWTLTHETFSGLLKGEYAQGIHHQIQDWLMATIQDESSRELLYRLVLIGCSFTVTHAERLSGIEPPIGRPFERLTSTLGVWVQRDSAATYAVSPLLDKLGDQNLAPGTWRRAHQVLGQMYLEKGTLDPLDMVRTMAHFMAAERHNTAAFVYIQALMAFNSSGLIHDEWRITSFWATQPITSDIDLEHRLLVRGFQISAYGKIGADASYLLQDLDDLLQQATSAEVRAAFTAVLLAGPLQANADVVIANRYLLKAVQYFPDVEAQLDFPQGEGVKRPEVLLWGNVTRVHNTQQLLNWMDTLEHFTPLQLEAASQSEFYEDGCVVASEAVFRTEAEKPKSEQNWDHVILTLEDLRNRAQRLGDELLWGSLVRASIDALALGKADLDAAINLAEASRAVAPVDPRVRFLIYGAIGQQMVRSRRRLQALPWLREALAQETPAYPGLRVEALLAASNADDGAHIAVEYARAAVDLGRQTGDISEPLLVQALGELGLAQWMADDRKSSLLALEEAVERMLAIKEDTGAWKGLFLACGHVMGYFTAMTSLGHPPGDDYFVPVRGWFLRDFSGVTERYDPANEYLLGVQLATFAEAMLDYPRAAKWALWAFETERGRGSETALAVIGPALVAHLIANQQVPEAMHIALGAAAATVAGQKALNAGEWALNPGVSAHSTLGSKPSAEWNAAEQLALVYSVVPLTLQLGVGWLADKDTSLAKALSAAQVCREIAREASNPFLWTSAAGLLEDTFAEHVSSETLVQKANALGAVSHHLNAVGYLGASIHSLPEPAVRLHLAICAYVEDALKAHKALYEYWATFVAEFWTYKFNQNRFRFRTPGLVETNLRQAVSTVLDNRVRSVLKVVASGLDIVPNPDAKAWLGL